MNLLFFDLLNKKLDICLNHQKNNTLMKKNLKDFCLNECLKTDVNIKFYNTTKYAK